MAMCLEVIISCLARILENDCLDLKFTQDFVGSICIGTVYWLIISPQVVHHGLPGMHIDIPRL